MLFNNGIASIELAYILDDINTASEAASNIITEYETRDPDAAAISDSVDSLHDLYESYGIKGIGNNDMDYLLAYIMCKNPDCYSDNVFGTLTASYWKPARQYGILRMKVLLTVPSLTTL